MSTTIDEKVVEMRFDNRDFEKNVKTTMDTIGSLNKSLKFDESAKSFSNLEKASKGVKFEGLSNAIETTKAKFSALAVIGVTALANITNSAVNAGKQIVKSLTIAPVKQGFDEYELKMGSVQTIMASTGESLQTVNKYLEELNLYADKTIYSFSDMTANIGKFTNAGVKLEDAVKAIKGISNEAAVSGANANEASRAMYNFAQALSSGAVKLIDWKSIENANMATVEFKQILLDTAEAMGTVVKNGEEYKSTTTDNNGKISEAFTATSKFNDSLSSQWMTTEVLVQALSAYSTDIREMTDAEKKAYEEKLKSIGYTEEQIDKIEKLGQKAFNAAQDVKTFTQLLDTLKEAAGSGWARTFELIFGDLNEAKKLWTAVSKEIGGIIDGASDARNATLSAWVEMGGREAIFDGIANVWKNIKGVFGAVKGGFKDIFPDISAKQLYNISAQFRKLTETLMANEEELDKIRRTFRGLTAVLDIGRLLLSSIFDVFKKIIPYFGAFSSGVLDGAASVGDFLVSLRDWIKENDIFTKGIYATIKVIGLVATGIDNLIQSITGHGVIELFQMLGDKVKYFYDVVKLIFQRLNTENVDVIAMLNEQFRILTGINFEDSKLLGFLQTIKSFFNGIKELISNIANGMSFREAINQFFGDSFAVDISKFLQLFDNFGEGVKKAWDKVSSAFTGMTGGMNSFKETLSKSWEKISESFTKAKEAISKAWEKIKEVLSEATGVDLSGIITFSKVIEVALSPLQIIFTVIGKLFDGLSWVVANFGPTIISVLKSLGEIFISLIQRLSDAISSANFNKVVDLFSSGAIAVVFTKLAQMLIGLKSAGKVINEMGGGDKKGNGFNIITFFKNLGKNGKEIVEKVGVLFDGVRDIFKAWQRDLQSNVLLKIASAIGILAVSLTILSGIDEKQLIQSLGAVTAMFVELIAAFKVLTASMTVSNNPLDIEGAKNTVMGVTQLTTFVLGMSAAMLIMSMALKKIANLDPKSVIVGIAGIGALFAEIIAVFKILSKEEKLLVKMPEGLIAMSTALYIMATAVKKLGKMDPASMMQGIGGIGAVLLEILAFMQLLTKSSFMNPESGLKSISAIASGLIVLSIALRMIVTSIKSMGKMDPDKLIQGLFGMFSVLTLIVGFIKYFESPKTAEGEAGIMRIASMMLVLSNAMVILATSMKIMGSMDFEQIGNGALGFFSMFASIILLMKNLQDETHILKIAASMNAMALALTVLALAMKIISTIPSEGVLKAVIAIDAVLGTLALFTMFTNDDSVLKVSGAMAAFAAALLILAPALKIIGTLDYKSIGAVVITLGSLFLVLGVAAKATQGFILPMIGLSGALALLGVAVLALGAGLTSLAVGLTSIAASGPAVIEFLTLFVSAFLVSIPKIIASTLKGIIDAILNFGEDVLIALLKVLNNVTPVLIETLFNILDKLIESLAKHLPSIVKNLTNLIIDLLDLLGKEAPRLINSLLNFVFNLIDGLGESIEKNSRRLVEVIGNLVVNLLMSALNMVFPWLVDWITGGTNELIDVVNTLSAEEQKLVERVGAMAESYKNVKDARDNSISNINTEYGYIKELRDEYNSLVDSNGNIISGFEDRAQMIKTSLAEAMGISVQQVEDLIDANGKLSESFDNVLVKMQAEAYLSANEEFYKEAVRNKVEARKSYYEAVDASLKNEEALASVQAEMKELDEKINKEFEAHGASFDYTEMSEQYEVLAAEEERLSGAVGKLDETRRSAENTLVGYEAELRNYSELQYAITTGNVKLMNETMEQLERGYVSNAEGTIMTLKKQVRDAEAEYKRLEHLRETNPGLVTKEEVEKAQYWLGVYRGDLFKLENGYTKVGRVGGQTMHRMASDIQNGSTEVIKAASNTEESIVEEFAEMPDDIGEIDADFISQIGGDMSVVNTLMTNGGSSAVKNYINSLTGGVPKVDKASDELAKTTIDPFKELPKEMEKNGIDVVLGLLKGIDATKSEVEKEAAASAAHYVAIVKERLGIKSPSKVFAEIGEYTMKGFIVGVSNLRNKVGVATSDVASTSIDVMSGIMSNISNILDSDLDVDPTIRPVLDLSNITDGVGTINSMFGARRTIGMAIMANRDSNATLSRRSNSPLNVNNSDITTILSGLREDVNKLNVKVGGLKVVMDTGTLVGEIAGPIDSALGRQTMFRGRGI